MSSTDVGQFIVRFVIFELGDIFILQLMIKILSVSLSLRLVLKLFRYFDDLSIFVQSVQLHRRFIYIVYINH